MKIRTFLLLLMLAAIVVFAALNWPTFITPSTLSLGFATVEAPLGLIMLGVLAALSLVFLAFLVYLQTSVLLDTRRHARELQSHRELADQAEASRFTELRKFIEEQMSALSERDADSSRTVLARIEQLETTVRNALDDSNNTLAAYLGQLEDRLERDDRPPPPDVPRRRDH